MGPGVAANLANRSMLAYDGRNGSCTRTHVPASKTYLLLGLVVDGQRRRRRPFCIGGSNVWGHPGSLHGTHSPVFDMRTDHASGHPLQTILYNERSR